MKESNKKKIIKKAAIAVAVAACGAGLYVLGRQKGHLDVCSWLDHAAKNELTYHKDYPNGSRYEMKFTKLW